MAIKAGRVGVRPDQVDDTGKIIFPEGSGPGGDSYTKEEADAKFATKSALSSGLATKANAANVYSKTAADEKFSTQTALAELAQSTQEALADKADADDVYTKTAADEKFATITALNAKADQSNLTANDNNFIFAYDSASGKYGYKAGGADTFHPFSEGSGNRKVVSGEILYDTGPTEDVVIPTNFGSRPLKALIVWVYSGSLQYGMWYDYYVSQTGYRRATKSQVTWPTIGDGTTGGIKNRDFNNLILHANPNETVRRLWYFISG